VSQDASVRRVGFVGLGNMGLPMARNLAGAGFELTVRDADSVRQEQVVSELGCAGADSPDAFGAVDAVVTMLPNGKIVREVLLHPEDGLASALRPGTVVVDMSSSEPTGTKEIGAALAERGVFLVDAPVSGGVKGAEAGKLSIMIGGDEEAAIERVRPLLEALGGRLFLTGPLGSGHAMKALNNYMSAAGYGIAAEALLVGARFGLDPATMVDVINASSGKNDTTERLLKSQVLSRQFSLGFSLALHAKDVGIAADLAEAIGIEAPLCQLTRRIWAEAAAAEEPGTDCMAAIRYWERLNGTELPITRLAEAGA
jgi:3-hydroxyisobutyrate dehydrogenase